MYKRQNLNRKIVKNKHKASWQQRSVKVVNRVCKNFPKPDFENWSVCEELLLSALATCEKIDEFSIETKNAGLLLSQTAYYLQDKGKYEQVEILYLNSLAISEKIFGKQHTNVAVDLNNLASFYEMQSRYDEAELLYPVSYTHLDVYKRQI